MRTNSLAARKPATRVKTEIRLLKEYLERLRGISERAQRETSGPARDQLRNLYNRLSPPMKELSQIVAQEIEHAALDEEIQVELRLRLAEFEQAIEATGSVLEATGSPLLIKKLGDNRRDRSPLPLLVFFVFAVLIPFVCLNLALQRAGQENGVVGFLTIVANLSFVVNFALMVHRFPSLTGRRDSD